jgi:hypothetical protein
MKKILLIISIFAGMLTACTPSQPESGSEEAVIEWMMGYYGMNRARANQTYDTNPSNLTRIYNYLSPHGRYNPNAR